MTKVIGPNLLTHLYRTHLYLSGVRIWEQTPKDMCLQEIWLHFQISLTVLGLIIVNIIGEDLHDHLRRERIFTFTMKIFIQAPEIMRKTATGMIAWFQIYPHKKWVLEKKVAIEDRLTYLKFLYICNHRMSLVWRIIIYYFRLESSLEIGTQQV